MLWWTRINWVTGVTIAAGLFFIIYLAIKCFWYPENKNRQRHLLLLCLILIHQIITSYFPDKNLNIPIVEQHLLLILTNVGFLPFCIFYVKEEFRSSRGKESQIRAVNQVLQENEATIHCLNEALTETESRIEAMNKELLEQKSLVQTLNLNIAEHVSNIKVLEKEIAERDVRISHLSQLLEANTIELPRMVNIHCLNQALTEIESRIEAMNKELLEQKSLVQTLNLNIAEHVSNIKVLEKEIAERDVRISRLSQPLEVNTIEELPRMVNKVDSDRSFKMNCKKYLTPEQILVIKLVDKGLTYEKIAKKREVKLVTIKKAVSNIGKRLKVNGREAILQKLKSPIRETDLIKI